jgi:hypothetical protein
MFHPLTPNLANLKDTDIDSKISDLNKKYVIVARSGNGGLCNQILLALEEYKSEQQRRLLEKTNVAVKNQTKDFSDLINID